MKLKIILIILINLLNINFVKAQKIIISNYNDTANLLIYNVADLKFQIKNNNLIPKSFSNWNKKNLGDIISISSINDSLIYASNSTAIFKINANTGEVLKFLDLKNNQINYYKNNLYVCSDLQIFRIDSTARIVQTFEYLNYKFTSCFCYRDRLYFAVLGESYTLPSDIYTNTIYSTKLSPTGAIYYDNIRVEIIPFGFKNTNYSNPIRKIKIKNDTLFFVETNYNNFYNNRLISYLKKDSNFTFLKIYEIGEKGNFSNGLAIYENLIIATGGNLINSNDTNLYGFKVFYNNNNEFYLQDIDNDFVKDDKGKLGDVEILQNQCNEFINYDTIKIKSQSQILTIPIKIITDSSFKLFAEFNKLDFDLITISNKLNENLEKNYYENNKKILVEIMVKDSIIFIDFEVFFNANKNKIIKLFTKNCCDTSVIEVSLLGCNFENRDIIFINDKLKLARK